MSGYEEESFEDYDNESFEDELEAPERPSWEGQDLTAKETDHADPLLVPSACATVTAGSILGLLGGHKQEQPDRTVTTLNGATEPADRNAAVAKKKLAQARQLMDKVTLTEVAGDDLLAMQPQSEYELMAQGKGPYSRVQAGSTQTGVQAQDVLDSDAQTEEVDVKEASSQAPSDPAAYTASSGSRGSRSSGSSSDGGAASRSSGGGGSSSGSGPRQGQLAAAAERLATHDHGLSIFLNWAGPAMSQELGRGDAKGAGASSSAMSFVQMPEGSSVASGYMHLGLSELLAGRRLVAMCHEPDRETAAASSSGGSSSSSDGGVLLCCAYAPVSMVGEKRLKEHGLRGSSVLCVWDTRGASRPEHVLVCEGVVTCCCWGLSPNMHLVFAGTEEGAIYSWDLSEPSSQHPQEKLPGTTLTITARRPAHTTEASALECDMAEPLVAIATAHRKGGGPGTPAARLGCLLVALSSKGTVSVYSVVVLEQGSVGGAQPDVGMRAGSRLYLLKMQDHLPLGLVAAQPSHLRPPREQWPVVDARALQLLPGESPQLLVAASKGKVLRGALSGVPGAPRELLPMLLSEVLEGGAMNPNGPAGELAASPHGQVLALHLSPFVPEGLITAHQGRTIMLHSLNKAHAVYTWPGITHSEVVGLRWLPGRPCAFLALDASNRIYYFDLMEGPRSQVQCMILKPPAGTSAAAALAVAAAAKDGKPPVPCCLWNAGSAIGVVSRGSLVHSAVLRTQTSKLAAEGHANGAGAGEGGRGALQWFAVGYANGSALFCKLADQLTEQRQGEVHKLREMLGICTTH